MIKAEPQPNLPLNCIDLGNPETFAQPCEGCPMLEVGCVALERSVAIKETLALKDEESATKEETNKKLLDRLLNLRMDTLIDTAFTPEGFEDKMNEGPEFQEELQRMRWGVVRLDGRFVGHVNKFGNRCGDLFLQEGGYEITVIADSLIRQPHDRRQQNIPVSEDRRQADRRRTEERPDRRSGQSKGGDYICRQGGDEFSLLIRDVDEAGLAIVAARIQNQLSVDNALDRYAHGNIPFIASVGYTHASAEAPKVLAALADDNPWEAFQVINGRADEGQRHKKLSQYDEMWDKVERSRPRNEQKKSIAQPEHGVIAEEFLRTLCPDFYNNPIQYMEDLLRRKREASQ